MKKIVLLALVASAVVAATQPNPVESKIKETSYPFKEGEKLEFKLNYGWFTVGKATMVTDDRLYRLDEKDCYKVKIRGRAAGLLNVFANVDDEWGALVDTDNLLPMMTYRNIQEGKYELEEKVLYNQDSGKIAVDIYKPRKKERKPTEFYESDETVFDMISGLLFMRNYDFNGLQKNDTISLRAFFEDTFYDFRVIYEGQEYVKTKVGKLRSHRMTPIMPQNKIFPGEKPITVWFTADSNRLPVKVKADMF
ncbi:MAG: DUF3108 domain-containing protein, partial [Cyclobacteriaceae bacterium]|nr:DUF3108 domain-containing protein [Cyclobacteriaceae bacterium HetDA_MAG_MS6]